MPGPAYVSLPDLFQFRVSRLCVIGKKLVACSHHVVQCLRCRHSSSHGNLDLHSTSSSLQDRPSKFKAPTVAVYPLEPYPHYSITMDIIFGPLAYFQDFFSGKKLSGGSATVDLSAPLQSLKPRMLSNLPKGGLLTCPVGKLQNITLEKI